KSLTRGYKMAAPSLVLPSFGQQPIEGTIIMLSSLIREYLNVKETLPIYQEFVSGLFSNKIRRSRQIAPYN
ncbi:hypothetical protein L9F63_004730, partial [Diploptera punctata]